MNVAFDKNFLCHDIAQSNVATTLIIAEHNVGQ